MCVQFYKFRSLEEKIAPYNSVRQSDERVTLTSECQLAGNLTSYFPYEPGKSSILYFHMELPCHSKQMLSATKTEQLILIVRIITLNFENSTHALTHTKYIAWKDAQFLHVAESGTYCYHYYLKLESKWTILR